MEKFSSKNKVIEWLLKGDVSIQYQVYRDLLEDDRKNIQEKITKSGWGLKFLKLRNKNAHWGQAFYHPKWTSTHYTLLDLKNLALPQNIKEISETINLILSTERSADGGIKPISKNKTSDVCINGMFLNYASYFNADEIKLKSIVDFLISQQMQDGGFNCNLNRIGAQHSSLHTTISALEGIQSFTSNDYKYQKTKLLKIQKKAEEFILMHRLFKSDNTGKIINPKMLRLSNPPRWYYDILRALDYFQSSKRKYDERMSDAIEILINKRTKDGKWLLNSYHPGKLHFKMENVGEPSRWNTLRVLRVFKFYNIN